MRNKIFFLGVFVIFFLLLFITRDFYFPYLKKIKQQAAAFFSIGITVDELIDKYKSTEKIKILLVPGHEPDFGGAEYGVLKERDLNVILSEKLKKYLSENDKFEITTTRDFNGWNPEFEKYVDTNKESILSWVKSMKDEMSRLVRDGKVTLMNKKIIHNEVNLNSAAFLYGINKWSSEKKVDMVIHIHFNDNPKYKGKPRYEGFSIYVPEKQYSNATSSKILAKDLMNEIIKIQKISTMKEESVGLVDSQELIAIGSYNTSDSLSVLIEYAYIYEDFMQYDNLRNLFINKAAFFTAEGVFRFFENRI